MLSVGLVFMLKYVQNNIPYYSCVDFGAQNGSIFFTNLIIAGIKNEPVHGFQVSFNPFQDNRHQADRRLHRTNDLHMLSSLQTTHRLSHLRLLYSSLHFMCMLSRDNSHFCFRHILPQYLPTWSYTCGIRTERP